MLGAAGLAIGLALQGTLSNFSSGVMLLIFRPFHNGDLVEIGGKAGFVEEIGVFTTTINTPDNVQVTIPNAAVYGEVIENYTGNETRRIDLVMGISYADDIPTAIRVMREVVQANARVLREPDPQIAVCELGDSSVNLVVRPWCKSVDYWDVRFELTQQLKEGLEAGGCSIPFPQRDLHLVTPPEGEASAAQSSG